ncbi:trypsin-like peptidase domain-containing protein [Streptomyces sp. NPDC002734]|uniref:S1C family serine protease n=1 Tax=Streptomyces sp. NPDC002734 TaxID=3154426 RepID=UPI003319CBF2
MSSENEGTAVPPVPSAPPATGETPAAPPAAAPPVPPVPTAPPAASAPTEQLPPVPAEQPAEQPAAHPHAAAYPHTAPDAGAQVQTQVQAQHQQPYAAAAQSGVPAAEPAGAWPPPTAPGAPGAPGGHGTDVWGAPLQQPAPKPRRGGRGLITAVIVAALVAGGVGGGIGFSLADSSSGPNSSTVVSAGGGSVQRAPDSVAGVAASALPSTVTIDAQNSGGEGGTGTGFVFDTEGHIVTNNHVVAEAVDSGKVTATFPDGKKYDAEVVGHAQGYDVAVIKLKNAPDNLKPLPLGDSEKVAVGDPTIAIGAPFGLSNTVTTGIISAKNRPVASSDGGAGSKASYMSALQTDASINPGNSGGPLLNADGSVIGINSAIQSAGDGFGTGQAGSIGLGFAIPINQAKFVAQELIKTGKPVYAKIGASVTMTEGEGGARIIGDSGTAVERGGPAAKAGLEPGDLITRFDDKAIDSGPALIGEIWTHKPGDTVKLTFERDGKERTVELTLGSRTGDN